MEAACKRLSVWHISDNVSHKNGCGRWMSHNLPSRVMSGCQLPGGEPGILFRNGIGIWDLKTDEDPKKDVPLTLHLY